MDPQRFDHVARYVATLPWHAGRSSRRDLIRLALAGTVASVAVGGATSPAGAAICRERVPKPGYTPEVNGCGPSGFGWVIPDSYKQANFTPACNGHDRCYGTCNSSRRTCDRNMLSDMLRACRRTYRGNDNERLRVKCMARAKGYYDVVAAKGQSAYEAAQEEACDCCEPGTTSCGRACCAAGSVCLNKSQSRCCTESAACGSTCCLTDFCFECRGGSCEWACGSCQWCNNGVCADCGVGCCGG